MLYFQRQNHQTHKGWEAKRSEWQLRLLHYIRHSRQLRGRGGGIAYQYDRLQRRLGLPTLQPVHNKGDQERHGVRHQSTIRDLTTIDYSITNCQLSLFTHESALS